MMNFRTEVNVDQHKKQIDYHTQSMFLGSCFATNIGGKFEKAGLNTLVNPYGVIYNPLSVANTIRSIVRQRVFNDEDLDYHNGLWNSFMHHSVFSDSDKERCLRKINENNILAHDKLKFSKFIFITFGTAWVYENKESNTIVSNCHKYPSKMFNRFKLNVERIINEYNNLIREIRSLNTDAELVFTVSPVRHWKDGAHENQLSKSTLLLAVDSIVEQNHNCSYFPAYEIVMDDLRDYRFYNEDMIHPNSVAVEYIWEKIKKCFFSTLTIEFIREMTNLDKAIQHKPFDSTAESYKTFLQGLLKKVFNIENKYPKANLEYIKSLLEKRLLTI